MAREIRSLKVFDWDGTLFRSPERPDWWWTEKWWTDPATLSEPLVPETPGSDWWNEKVCARARQSAQDPTCLTILVTGRQRMFHRRIHVLMKQARLRFDAVHLSDGSTTESFKLAVLKSYLDRFPSIRDVSIWEDRAPHLKMFVSWVESQGVSCQPHLVVSPPHELGCTEAEWLSISRVASLWDLPHRVASRFLTKVS